MTDDFYGDMTAAEHYLTHGGAPTSGALALMAEVERGRERARQLEAEEEEPFEVRMARMEAERLQDSAAREQFLQACRRATPAEYAAWLSGHLRAGGKVTHPYDYALPRSFYVLERYADPPELYGALSLSVIVPADVPLGPDDLTRTFHGCSGHNSFFFMNDFWVLSSTVPSYADVEPLVR